MTLSDKELLRRLGSGATISSVCEAACLSRQEFNARWQRIINSRAQPQALEPSPHNSQAPPGASASTRNHLVLTALHSDVTIERNEWGIPHIVADQDEDLFFGFGYAMAQDRLFQLDYLRRKGHGRLAEILGPEGLDPDLLARTVGLHRIARAEWDRISATTQSTLQAFTAGINALIKDSADKLPVEFDLLDYRPEPWSPIDCLAIENEFRWYLTGRFPIIAIPELVKRAMGDGARYQEFCLGEDDDESILTPDMYAAVGTGQTSECVGQAIGDPDANIGSNNWVVAGALSQSGKPLLASDPHIAFEAVSCWYEAHLDGGAYHVAGMSYVGIPAIMFGRTRRVAWGITNNICSQRDLYQEKTHADHPDCFRYGDQWEPARELVEEIAVRNSETVTKTIRYSRNGPIVDEVLPPPADKTGPVSLKWLGAYQGGWLTALQSMNQAKTVDEFREAMRPWHVPTFSLVIADVDGHLAMQSSGRVPIRKLSERGYRPGWDPDHQWQGLIPFEAMPYTIDPERGWMATANNRMAASDFPYPLFGCWSSGCRARRIRQLIEDRPPGKRFTLEDFRAMQQDALTLRAVRRVPQLIQALAASSDPRVLQAVKLLEAWDCHSEPNVVAPTLFNVFFSHWAQCVANEHLDSAAAVKLVAKGADAISGRLLQDNRMGWFHNDDRERKILETFVQTLDYLSDRLGADMTEWKWGNLHRMPLQHVLSSIGELSELLDHGGAAVRGDMGTVCNTGSGPDWEAASGAGYRMIADLGSEPPSLWAVDAQSQSGHPGSPHYADQFRDWITGNYHELKLGKISD